MQDSYRGLATPRRFMALSLAGLVLAVALWAVGAVSQNVAKADAYSFDTFCGNGAARTYIPAGGRCVDGRRVRHRYVEANILTNTGSGEYCVGAKQNADGTGANTKGFGCSYPWLTYYTYSGAQAPPGSPLGYATIINHTGIGKEFWGIMHWYP
jgi:hypothetical protein